jgi:hypothetical protein
MPGVSTKRPIIRGKRTLVAQFDIPVREIDKVLPEIVLGRSKRDLNKWPPLRPLRFADQAHVRFSRKTVAFTRVARNTRANHVFPSRCPASVARHDVVQIELAAIEELSAVLAGVFVSLKHVVSGEFYFLLRKPIEHKQHDHPWDPDLERNGRNHFMLGRVGGQIAPAFEIVRRKVVRVIRRNNLRVSCVYERKGPASGADVHGLPEPVEYQNLTVQ